VSIKILSAEHYKSIEQIFHDNFEAVSNRQFKKIGVAYPKDELYVKMTALWFSALTKYYLNTDDTDHVLMGLFVDNTLAAYVAVRYDLPDQYNDGWVVSYLKADPAINIINNGGLRQLWIEMFDYSESRGKKRWHTITEKKRHSAFDAFGIKVVPEINNRYDFYTLCDVPRGTKSDIDWVYAMMGKMIHYDKDYIVRTGILKTTIL
jgi:hypothetical protein